MKNEAFAQVCRQHRLIPVAVIDDADSALDLGRALVDAGLPIIEVTLRTPAALPAIAALTAEAGPAGGSKLLVGAGTVLTPAQADAAVAAGASFIVSPGYSPAVVARCLELGVFVLPGVGTAGEMMAVLAQGLDMVKFFPAAQLGGPTGLEAYAPVFEGLGFIPTGGVGLNNLARYLAIPAVRAVGGGWMVPRQAIARGDFATINQLTRQAVAAVQGEATGGEQS